MSLCKRTLIDKAYVHATKFLNMSVDAPEFTEVVYSLCLPFAMTLFTKTCVEQRLTDIKRHQGLLVSLRELPVIEQRTPIWYETRQRLITASDMAQALGLGKFGNQRDLLIKKSGYKPDTFNGNLPPLVWGVKYEPVANEIYKLRNCVEVYEFGLLQHPNVPFFGASPDGINELGVMVEIKCPFRSKLTGEILEQYYIQMQGQLDVCDLDDCDFVQCGFVEYDSIEAFDDDSHEHYPVYTKDLSNKGVFMEYVLEGATSTSYVYGPINASLDGVRAWVEVETEKLKAMGNVLNMKPTFWKLGTYNCRRVTRDKEFIQAKYVELEQVWNKILAYKADKELYDKEIDPPTVANTKLINIRSRKSSAASDAGSISITTPMLQPTMPTLTEYSFLKRDNDDFAL